MSDATGMMDDLNDLRLFAEVVEHGGFAAAARRLGMPKSTLSRRVAALEASLGVRLLHRSTRALALTDVGRSVLGHCETIIAEARAAREAVDSARSTPSGLLRVSCPPPVIASHVGELTARFMVEHPAVRVRLEAVNRRVDVIDEGFDIAIRVRTPPLEDSDLSIRVLESHGSVVAAAPAFLDRVGRPAHPDALRDRATLDMTRLGERHVWTLIDAEARAVSVELSPRLVTHDMGALRVAALAGVGVVMLPLYLIRDDIDAGRLERVLPDFTPPKAVVHAVFPSRRGVVPAVRAFLDALTQVFADSAST